jgi:hypothetical protein
VSVCPGKTWKIRNVPEDLDTVSRFGPGPLMVMFLSIASSALVRLMVCPLSAGSKLIVSPSVASASAWRSEPAPLSCVLVTVMVAAYAAIAIAQSSATQIAAQPIGTILVFM